jgi:hypothetical protein
MARVTPGSNTGEHHWEGEEFAGRGMTGGARMAVRERGGVGWVGLVRGGLGRLVSRVRPKWAPGLFLLFFSSVFFSFVSDFCFEFLKRLLNSDLNKIKADHFWSLKRCVHNLKKTKV